MHEEHRQRMREKLFQDSPLSDHELLEILLYSVLPRVNTNGTAHFLLDNFKSLDNVLHASKKDLLMIEGVGEQTASYLITIGKIMDRCVKSDDIDPPVYSLGELKPHMIKMFESYKEEMFCVFLLNKHRQITGKHIITTHKTNSVDIDLDDLRNIVIENKPHYVLLAHNHLSGILKPSNYDDRATEKICLLLSVSNVSLLDHIIVTKDDVYSYYYDGRLKPIIERIKKVFY